MKFRRLSITRAGWLVLVAALAAGCGASFPGAVAIAEEAGDPDTCAGHPLLGALPFAITIAGLSRQSMNCNWFSVQVAYGAANADGTGRFCQVHVTDLKAPIPPFLDRPELLDLAKLPLDLAKATYHVSIELQVGHREVMGSSSMGLELIGGPEHLPIVETLPGGRYVIAVPTASDGPVETHLYGLVRDERYGVMVSCQEKIRDQTSAMAVYSPWIAALNLEALP